MDISRKMVLGESPGELTCETRLKFYPCLILKVLIRLYHTTL